MSNGSGRSSLPKLPDMDFYVNILHGKPARQRNDKFDPQMNATELAVTMNLLWAFLDLCDQYRIEVMLYGGTLLGSYRHHGIMPWDDDVDLLLKESDMDLLETALSRSKIMELTQANRWKVWNKTACLTRPSSWCWPFIDISFYRVQGDFIHDTSSSYDRFYSYPVHFTFPLHRRPFMGRWVASPRDALRFLGFDKTPTGDCVSLYYSHRLESRIDSSRRVPCVSLATSYPFVVRAPRHVDQEGSSGVLESLHFLGSCVIYAVPVDEPLWAANAEFSTLHRDTLASDYKS